MSANGEIPDLIEDDLPPARKMHTDFGALSQTTRRGASS